MLLARLDRLARALRKTITIVSGARTRANNMGVSGSHHIPGNNPSGMGEAVDAYIGKTALASAVKERTLAKYGLYSGNRPGFYKGAPDPEHIETLERRGGKYKGGPPAQAPTSKQAPTSAPDQPAAQGGADLGITPTEVPSGPPSPESTIAAAYQPGSVQADVATPNKAADTWQLLAADPLSSPETQSFARRLGEMKNA